MSLALIRERMRQNDADRQRSTDKESAKLPTPEQRLGVTLFAGTRVRDLVTGQEGEVIGGTIENIIVPTSGR